MKPSEKIAVEMLEEIDRGRANEISLQEMEERLWRLLDRAGAAFPPTLSSKVEDLVLELRRLQEQNLSWGGTRDADENRGTEVIYNDVIGALSRFLG